MEKIFEQGMLYDFYGELLTPHQRSIYEDAVFQDMSLSEIAENLGISRQGVHDQIRRCDRILQEYEEKLQLVARFAKAKEMIGQIVELTRIEEQDVRMEEMQDRMNKILNGEEAPEGFFYATSSHNIDDGLLEEFHHCRR